MRLVFSQELGYVECNICGSGQNTISVSVDPWARYDYTRNSKCYGKKELKGLDATNLLQAIHEDNFLVATRRARSALKDFVGLVRADNVQSLIMAPPCQDTCCNPDIERGAVASVAPYTISTTIDWQSILG